MAARVGRDIRLLLPVLTALLVPAAHGDLKVHANGLIYDSATLASLRIIADSVTTAYRTCPTYRRYRSRPQATGHFVRFKNDAAAIRKDLAAGLPYAELVRRHARTIQARRENLSITLDEFAYDPKDRQAGYYFFDEEGEYDRHFTGAWFAPVHGRTKVKGTWIFEDRGWKPKHLEAFWFDSDLLQRDLPIEYAVMIGYADCLIDTNTTIHPEAPEPSSRGRRGQAPNDIGEIGLLKLWALYPGIRKFMDLVEIPRLEYPDTGQASPDDYQEFSRRWEWFQARKAAHFDSVARLPAFPAMLEAAVAEGLRHGLSSEELEDFCARYLSKRKALTLKRSRRVMGNCSMDDSPRLHAQEIAVLSAEAREWDVFLRAHLDILNDRFDRRSDGSYAWERRGTYLRELEGLGMDLHDLLFGIAFDIQFPARNHYQGNVGRLGRAIAEATDREGFLERTADMIRDPALDDHNRILMFFLYLSAVRHLKTGEQKEAGSLDLHETVSDLPSPLGPVLRGFLAKARI